MDQQNEQRKYWVRCRFDFADGRPSWFSMWNQSGPNPTDQAWRQNKTGLVRAAIEAKCQKTRRVFTVAECDGHDFVNFEWQAVAPMGAMGGGGSTTLHTTIVGLVLVTRNERTVALMDGRIGIVARSEADKKMHLVGFGR